MKFVSDPSIAIKVNRMRRRVRWQHPEILKKGIDQTRLVLPDETRADAFSFMVIGDSGAGYHSGDNPQRRVAEWLMENSDGCEFVMHTGDLIYLVGSSEQYRENFIEPYREWIVGGESPAQIRYDQMRFKLPFLPTPGNHDYYDLPIVYGLLMQVFGPLLKLFRQFDLDVGRHGSYQGDAYARAFLDYLTEVNEADLAAHLDRYYTAQTHTGRALSYQPGQFTRLPNRYYRL
ncbi:MAG: metallophosphoesterase, partial [Leptolyngbya sp. SIO4C1]|nr:metallophosphoesterase [Leptolyngbya sp. SIO4C1]